MKIRGKHLLIAVCLLAAMATVGEVKETDIDATYFHPAASMYIHGDAAGASNLVARGLSLFPDDGKLKRLKELLDQQQEQEQEQENQEEQQSEPPPAEQMTQDEAEQLLDAMRQEEQNKRLQLHPVLGAPVKVDKDW